MRAKQERQAIRKRLRAVGILAPCNDRELDAIDQLLTEVRFREGETLTREGAGALEFMILAEGHVRVERSGETIADLGPGDFVGELGLLDKAPRNATVTAREPVRAYVLHAGEFSALLDAAPEMRAKIEATAAVRRA